MFTIPTDNLYKFIAVFGLSLVVAGFSLSYVEFGNYRNSDSAIQGLKAEIDFKLALAENKKRFQEKKLEELNNRMSSGANVTQLDVKEMEKLYLEFEKLTEELVKFTALETAKMTELKTNIKYSFYSGIAFFVLIVFGCALTVWGFLKWKAET